MTLLTSQRAAAYLASGAAFGSVLLSGEVPAPLVAFVVLAFVLSYVVGERTAGRASLAWNLGIIGSFVYLAVAVFTAAVDIVLATSIFVMLVALHRLYNRRAVRDYGFVHLTSLLLVAGGSALSAELAFGGCFLVFAVGCTWSLTLTHLRQEIEEEAAHNRVPDGGASVLADRRLVSASLLGALGGLALAALGVAALVFATFPRVSFGLWRRVQPAGQHAGFSDQVELGGHGRIKDDPRVAFRVKVVSGHGAGPALDLYWRGAAFNVYDGHGWRDTGLVGAAVRQSPSRWYEFGPAAPEADEYEVALAEDSNRDALFFTGRPVAVRLLPQEVALRVLDAPRLARDELGDFTIAGGQTTQVRYLLRATVQPAETALRGLGRDYEPDVRRLYLQLPGLDPRVVDLAHRLTDGKDPTDAVYAVEGHFRSFRYTMQMLAGGPDPLASFLFDVKAGHCEYFATSMAVLLRVAGIPSRVVTGYYGGRLVERGSYYAVREGDAHAWVEVNFPGKGWVTFDPTPPQAREAMLENLYGAFQLWLDGVRTSWRSTVVEYDLATQLRGLKGALDILHEAGARLSGNPVRGGLAAAGKTVALGVGLAGLVALGLVAARRRRRPAARTLARSEAQVRAGRLYVELVRRLGRRGLKVRPSQTPREVAGEAHARGLAQAAVIGRVVERYLATRYGGAPLEPAELEALRRELRRV